MNISRALNLSLFALAFFVFTSVAMAQPRPLVAASNVDVSHVDVKAKPLCLASHQQGCQRPRPPKIYTELNYIDPAGSGCPDGLCTNGVGGVINTASHHSGNYYSPSTFWTQSQSGFLHQVRIVVSGQDRISEPTYFFQNWEDFSQHDYRIELWEGFEEFEASPHLGPIRTQANLVPVNENKGIPVGYTSQGHANFEFIFDVSDYEFALQEGQDYVLVVRALGEPLIDGWVLRSASAIGSPADVAASNFLEPGFVDLPPYSWPVNRLGTQIRVKIP